MRSWPTSRASRNSVETRRSFLGGLLALGTSAVGMLLAIPLARFSLDPLWRTTSEVLWSDAGAATDFTSLSAPVKVQLAIEQRDGWRKVLSQNGIDANLVKVKDPASKDN